MVEHANSSANLQPIFPFPKIWHIQLHHCWIMIISTIAPFSFPVSFSFQAVPRVATNPAVTRRARPRPVRWSALRCSRCELRFSASSPTWTLKPCWGRPRCVATGGLWHATPPSGQECCWRMLASLPRFCFFFLSFWTCSHHTGLHVFDDLGSIQLCWNNFFMYVCLSSSCARFLSGVRRPTLWSCKTSNQGREERRRPRRSIWRAHGTYTVLYGILCCLKG